MADNENYSRIILLLEAGDKARSKRDEDMEHIQKDIAAINEHVSGIKVYFTGLDPRQHILDHIRMVDLVQMAKDIDEVKKMVADLPTMRRDLHALNTDKASLLGGWRTVTVIGALVMSLAALYGTFA